MHQPPDNTNLTGRLARLAAALLEHFLALSSLASWETKQGLKQALLYSLFLFFTLTFGLIGYLLLLSIFIIVATSLWNLSLIFALSLLALGHFLVVGMLLFVLYRKQPTSFLELTRNELLRDIEALNHN